MMPEKGKKADLMFVQHMLAVRGAFANYVDRIKADFKSIAASGWEPAQSKSKPTRRKR